MDKGTLEVLLGTKDYLIQVGRPVHAKINSEISKPCKSLCPKFQVYLKVVSATFLLACFLSLKESTCGTWKNVFYFTSKAFFSFSRK